jgi:hypothetical protein
MADLDTLFPSRFTKGVSLESPMTIRIVSIGGEMIEGDDGEKSKAVLKYRSASGEAELVLNKTNALLIAACLGTRDYTAWAGRTITIGYDPTVMLGRERVGGIRVVGSPEIKATLRVEVKRPRRKRPEVYTLQPTDKDGRVRGVASTTAPAKPNEVEGEREPGGEG